MTLRAPRIWSAGLLVLLSACGDGGSSTASATADPASSTAASAAANSADPAPSVASTATGTASAAEAPTSTGTADAAAPAEGASASQAKLQALQKIAKNGVLPKGEADKVMKVGDPSRVMLIDAGADPKEELKYDFKPSVKETTLMKMDMTMKMDLGAASPGGPGGMTLPQIEMALDMSTADKNESNGDMRLAGMVSNVKVSPGKTPMEQQVGKAMGDALTGMKGMKIGYLITPKGRTRDVKVELPPNAPPQAQMMVEQTKQSFENMMAPLPDESVGVGGKWIVLSRVSTGADILQWTTYTLKKRDGSKLELEAVVSQLAASPTITGPQMQGDANIDAFNSGGSGQTWMDLSRIAPDKGTADVKSSMSFSAKGQSMKIDTLVKLAFARK